MIKGIEEFMYLLGMDSSWGYLIIGLLLLLGITKCLYPWQPKWKSVTTEDEDDKKVTTYYHLDV